LPLANADWSVACSLIIASSTLGCWSCAATVPGWMAWVSHARARLGAAGGHRAPFRPRGSSIGCGFLAGTGCKVLHLPRIVRPSCAARLTRRWRP